MSKKLIDKGTVLILNNFLENYDEFKTKFNTYEFKPTHQPNNEYYENRFQAYPTWETNSLEEIDNTMFNIIKDKIQQLFELRIEYLECKFRYTLSSEFQKSKLANSEYAYIHSDVGVNTPQENVYGGVLYLNTTVSGGTAFFKFPWDKCPDIKIGAVDNRMILYSAKRQHAACQDNTVEKRCVLLIGMVLDEKN